MASDSVPSVASLDTCEIFISSSIGCLEAGVTTELTQTGPVLFPRRPETDLPLDTPRSEPQHLSPFLQKQRICCPGRSGAETP